MSASNSHLSNEKYGYDLVIATTQNSINGTAKYYLNRLARKTKPVGCFKVTYYDGNEDVSVIVNYEELKERFTDGYELISVPDGDKENPVFDILDKNKVDGISGFIAQLGLPKKNWDKKRENLIEFVEDKQVVYKLTCHTFSIYSYTTTRRDFEWKNKSQGSGEYAKPWIFTVKVPLKDVAHEGGTLPEHVQNRADALQPGTFSVQKLILDLDNCLLHESPEISGVDEDSDVYIFLQKFFVNNYLKELKDNGGFILDYRITHFKKPENSTLFVTDINLTSQRNEDNPGLSTINYLGTTDGKKPRSLSEFDWQWIDSEDDAGIMAINRTAFAKAIVDEILPQLKGCCFDVGSKVWYDGLTAWYEISASWWNAPDHIKYPLKDTTVATISYEGGGYDSASHLGFSSAMKVESYFDAEVKFDGYNIVVVQHLKFFLKLDDSDKKKGWPVDTKLTDTYALGVDSTGMLVLQKQGETQKDEKGKPLPHHWWSGVNNVAESFSKWIGNLASAEFHDMKLESLGHFYFPGGNVFTFKDPKFSNYQDLLAKLSYKAPKPE